MSANQISQIYVPYDPDPKTCTPLLAGALRTSQIVMLVNEPPGPQLLRLWFNHRSHFVLAYIVATETLRRAKRQVAPSTWIDFETIRDRVGAWNLDSKVRFPVETRILRDAQVRPIRAPNDLKSRWAQRMRDIRTVGIYFGVGLDEYSCRKSTEDKALLENVFAYHEENTHFCALGDVDRTQIVALPDGETYIDPAVKSLIAWTLRDRPEAQQVPLRAQTYATGGLDARRVVHEVQDSSSLQRFDDQETIEKVRASARAFGKTFFDEGNRSEAERLTTQLAIEHPDSPYAQAMACEDFIFMRKGPEALKAVRQALILNHSISNFWLLLGRAFDIAGKWEDSLEILALLNENAIRRHDDPCLWFFDHGPAGWEVAIGNEESDPSELFAVFDSNAKVKSLERRLAVHPEEAAYYRYLGHIHLMAARSGRDGDADLSRALHAASAFRHAYDIDSTDANRRNLAIAWHKAEDNLAAVEALGALVKEEPENDIRLADFAQFISATSHLHAARSGHSYGLEDAIRFLARAIKANGSMFSYWAKYVRWINYTGLHRSDKEVAALLPQTVDRLKTFDFRMSHPYEIENARREVLATAERLITERSP